MLSSRKSLHSFSNLKGVSYMRKIVLVLLALMLAACGDEAKFKDLVRDQLKDPGSANFKDVKVSANGKRACILWNAKNSMGGYGNWEVAEFSKADAGWSLKTLKGIVDDCSEEGFKAIDEEESARPEAYQKAIDLLQKAKGISHADAVKMAEEGQCKSLINDYGIVAALQARWKDPALQVEYVKKLKSLQNGLEDGTCRAHP
jgi:hypothetical protein